MKTIVDFQFVLSEIYRRRREDFSGIGLIVYKSLLDLPIASLKNIDSTIHLPIVSRTEMINFLVDASGNNNKYHDGFHLLNEKVELTHISQFVSPAIIDTITMQPEYGSRYRTAIYSSYLPNVIACGVLSNSYPPTVFVKGEAL